ncbi:hypothetical protein [Coralliovum pocilloporae]|uniref:hypothetical protein n=1 Tax=Coralliovum pocilloporae TaxID=3066369 RepID=UPI00330702D3
MPAPQFSQSTGSPSLYWLDGGVWSSSGAFGLVLYPTTTGAPASLTLPQSWQTYPGYYVSIAQKPTSADEPKLVETILSLVASLGADARFFWLKSASGPSTARDTWEPRALYVTQQSGQASGTLNRPTVFPLGAYRFSVSGGQTITPTSDGFSISGSVNPAFQLVTEKAAWPLSPQSNGATVLSVNGATAGTFLLNGSLVLDGSTNDYALLDISLRFGVPDQSDPQKSRLLSLHYPIFATPPASTIGVTFRCDPAGLLDAKRTSLVYRGNVSAQVCHYTTQLGYGVSLTPNGHDATTGLDAGFAFHKRPDTTAGLDGDDPLYLGPIGPYLMTIGTPPGASGMPAARLTGGVSGIEYFGFSSGQSVPVTFTPDQLAFAPDFPPAPDTAAGQNQLGGGVQNALQTPQLTNRATAPYALIASPASGQAAYYAQPDDSSFFAIRPDNQNNSALLPYLTFLELVTSTLGANADAFYPLLPYRGARASDLSLMQALEAQILSPLRRTRITDGLNNHPRASAMALADIQTDCTVLAAGDYDAVTPQGIKARFNSTTMTALLLSPEQAGAQLPQLAFNTPSDTFRQALQSNQLFLVAADGTLLQNNVDLNYWITQDVLGDLTRLTGAEAIPAAVISLLSSQSARAPQTSKAAFTTMLQGILTGTNAQYIPTVTKYAAYFQLDIESWRFRLSPALWADNHTYPTVMIFKFTSGSLYDFAQNTESWAWPDVGKTNGSLADTRTILNQAFKTATDDVAAKKTESPFYDFVTNVLNNPGWTGILFLNANVPFSSVPPELSGLAAGISPDLFLAHHVGISVTPISVDTSHRTLSQSKSSIFGLINYDQPKDIAHISSDFDFKVLLLQVLFENSAIANFAGRIELFINRLFGALVTLQGSDHYNNIILDGSYQRQGASGHYSFTSSHADVFTDSTVGKGGDTNTTVLISTEFDQAQFVTETADAATSTTTQTRFLLQGKLRFADFPAFDAFSFGPTYSRNGAQIEDGYLTFSGLSIDMSFPVATPSTRTFVFNLDAIAFDAGASKTRPTSFFQRFPLQIGGLTYNPASTKPADLGYMALETPLAQPGFSGDWYGLVLNVDLGTLGALSSSSALSAEILAAWSPTPTGSDINIGLKLPGVESARSLLPLQGVIDLGFQAIDLSADGALNTPPDPAYVLRFRNFYLRFLGWKFPPGQNTIALFGNPDAATQNIATDRGALGWYAAYAKKDDT